jgi:hypothetical protein
MIFFHLIAVLGVLLIGAIVRRNHFMVGIGAAILCVHPLAVDTIFGDNLFILRDSFSIGKTLDAAGYYLFHIALPFGILPEVVRYDIDIFYSVIAGAAAIYAIIGDRYVKYFVVAVFLISAAFKVQPGNAYAALPFLAVIIGGFNRKSIAVNIVAVAVIVLFSASSFQMARHWMTPEDRAAYALRHVSCKSAELIDCEYLRPLPRSAVTLALYYEERGDKKTARFFYDLAFRAKTVK